MTFSSKRMRADSNTISYEALLEVLKAHGKSTGG
jgi:hypothetical protein